MTEQGVEGKGDSKPPYQRNLLVTLATGDEVDVVVEVSAKTSTHLDAFLMFPNVEPAPDHWNVPEDDDGYCGEALIETLTDMLHVTEDIKQGCRLLKPDMRELMKQSTPEDGFEDVMHSDVAVHLHKVVHRWWRDEASMNQRIFMATSALMFSQKQIMIAMNAVADSLITVHRARIGQHPICYYDMLPKKIHELPVNRPDDILAPEHIGAVLSTRRYNIWMKNLVAQHMRTMVGIGAMHPREMAYRLREEYTRIEDEQRGDMAAMLADAADRVRVPPDYGILYAQSGSSGRKRRMMRNGRKIVRRSIAAYERLFGGSAKANLMEFMRGKPLMLRGKLYTYRFMRTWSAVEHSAYPQAVHVPYALSIYNAANERLANGCIYFRDTPLVDQIIAVALHLRTEEDELDLLSKMNLSALTPAFTRDARLPGLKPDVPEMTWKAGVPHLVNMFADLEEEVEQQGQFDDLKREALPIIRDMMGERVSIPKPVFDFMADPHISIAQIENGMSPDDTINKFMLFADLLA